MNNNDILYAILFLIGFTMIMVVVMKYFVSWYFQIGRIVGALEGIDDTLKKALSQKDENSVVQHEEVKNIAEKLEDSRGLSAESKRYKIYKKLAIFGIVLLMGILVIASLMLFKQIM